MIITVDQMPKKATLIELAQALAQIIDQLDYEEVVQLANDIDSDKYYVLKDLLDSLNNLFGYEDKEDEPVTS